MSSNPARSSTPNQNEGEDTDPDIKLRTVRVLSSDGDHEEASVATQSDSIAPHHQSANQESQSATPPTESRQPSDTGSASNAQPRYNPSLLLMSESELWDLAERVGEKMQMRWAWATRTGPWAETEAPDPSKRRDD
ncbi:hypothetical protein FRC00_007510 [Tulasnella sp. 408]|nr:hypothetical protein FRC00_007510 [Tulasnella sp. 408]